MSFFFAKNRLCLAGMGEEEIKNKEVEEGEEDECKTGVLVHSGD
jgi:hypothetical protein